jgi:hypothetical protein
MGAAFSAVSLGESQALARQAVKTRRRNLAATERAQFAIAKVIGNNENNVRARGAGAG